MVWYSSRTLFLPFLLAVQLPNVRSLLFDGRNLSPLSRLEPRRYSLLSRLPSTSGQKTAGRSDALDHETTGDDDSYLEHNQDHHSFPSLTAPLSVSSELSDDASRPLFSRNTAWLEEATLDMLDEEMYPLGKLSEDDVEAVVGLMAAWARRRSLNAAITVERLLKRVVDDMRAGNMAVHVSTRFYAYAIDAWAKSSADGSAQRAQSIHDAMVQMYETTKDPRIAPSTFSYNSLMNAWSKSNDADSATKADDVLMQLVGAASSNNTSLKPDASSFSTVLHAYANSEVSSAVVKRCEELFEMMDELRVNRNCYTYSAMQTLYARSQLRNGPEKARAVLDRMLALYEGGDLLAKPNSINFNDVLTAYSRVPSNEYAEAANELLSRMEAPVEEGGYDVEPDRLSYALAILACARAPDEVRAATLAEDNLRKLETRADIEALKKKRISSAAPPSVTLDVESFNVVITAISKSRQHHAPERALKIVERMKKYESEGNRELRPNLRTWNALLNCFARAAGRKDRDFARDSERILESMLRYEKKATGDIQTPVQPDAFTFAAVLNALQRSNSPSATQRADNLVRKMEELFEAGESQTCPDVFHYTILASIWARSGLDNAPDRCLQILIHMYSREQKKYANVKPNVRTYNAVLDCLSRANQVDRAEQLLFHMLNRFRRGDKSARPDSFSFNSVIHAHTKSRGRGSGRRAEAVLDRFLEFQEENPSVQPDTRSFSHIITHYSRSSEMDAPYRAEYVMNRMLALYKSGHTNLVPSLRIILTVMDKYSYSNHPDAGRNAERLLKLIQDLSEEYNTPKLVINTAVINSVMLAWANSGDECAAHHAEFHLQEMETSFEHGKMELQPDTRSYGLVLSAWSKSSNPEKAKRSLELYRHMEEVQKQEGSDVHVCEHAASLVINACAFSNAAPEDEAAAFEIAVSLFDEMLSSDDKKPSSLTYGWFLQACGRLGVANERRMSSIEKAFTHCCEAGLLNDFVFHRFKGATTEEQFWDLIGPWTSMKPHWERKKSRMTLEHLPSDGTKNCTSERRQPT